MKTSHKIKAAKGFTLPELLVSMLITIILLGILIYVARSGFDTLQAGRGDITSGRKAEVALEALSRDLESMVYQPQADKSEWLVAKSQVNDEITDSSDGGVRSFSSDLTFFTVARDRYNGEYLDDSNDVDNPSSFPGDVCTVQYGISFEDPITDDVNSSDLKRKNFVLYRRLVDPNTTFTLTDKIIGEEDLVASLNNVGPGPLISPNNIITDSIRELTVTFNLEITEENEDGDLVKTIRVIPLIDISSSQNNAADLTLQGSGILLDGELIEGARILSIDINAQILEDESAGFLRLNSLSDGAQENLERKVRRFSKTIHLSQLN